MVKSFKTNLLTWLKTKTYIKTEIDELLQLKSNIGHTHTNASTTTPGFLSAEDKTKLNNLKQITVELHNKCNKYKSSTKQGNKHCINWKSKHQSHTQYHKYNKPTIPT